MDVSVDSGALVNRGGTLSERMEKVKTRGRATAGQRHLAHLPSALRFPG